MNHLTHLSTLFRGARITLELPKEEYDKIKQAAQKHFENTKQGIDRSTTHFISKEYMRFTISTTEFIIQSQ